MVVGFLTMRSLLPKHFRAFLLLLLILTLLCAWQASSLANSDALSADASVQTAKEAFDKYQYDAALNALAPALQLRPADPEVLNLKGAILTKQNNLDAAGACYAEALKSSPGFFPARYNIGALLALRHQWDDSINYFRNLLIDQPNNELVEFKLLLLLLQRNADPGLQAKLFATDLPTNTPAWYFATAARSYKKGDAAKAAKYLEVAKNIYGDQTAIFQEELDESGLNHPEATKK